MSFHNTLKSSRCARKSLAFIATSLPVLVLQPFYPTSVWRNTIWKLKDHFVKARSSAAEPCFAVLIDMSNFCANISAGFRMGRGSSEPISDARRGHMSISVIVGIGAAGRDAAAE